MTKKTVKSIYHWSLMFLVMGAPLLLSTISALPNTYGQSDVAEYEVFSPADQLYVGHSYHFSSENRILGNASCNVVFGTLTNIVTTVPKHPATRSDVFMRTYSADTFLQLFDLDGYYDEFVGSFDFTYASSTGDYRFLLPYITEKKTLYAIDNPAFGVWQFEKDFLNLPINAWYKDLLNTLVGGYSDTYNNLEYLKVYPLWALWVLLFDVVYDCLAVLPHLGHKFLESFGDKE